MQALTANGEHREVRLVAHNLGHLERKIRKLRTANGLPEGQDVQQEILDQLWERRPELCRDTAQEKPVGRIASFARAMIEWRNSGFQTVPDEVLHERQGHCLDCEHWRGWKTAGIGVCRKCGCPAGRLTLKLYLPDQVCPVGKWGKV